MQWKLEQHTYTIRDQLLQLGIKDTTYQLLVKSLHFSHISIIFVMHLGKRYALKKNLPSDQNYDFKRNYGCIAGLDSTFSMAGFDCFVLHCMRLIVGERIRRKLGVFNSFCNSF